MKHGSIILFFSYLVLLNACQDYLPPVKPIIADAELTVGDKLYAVVGDWLGANALLNKDPMEDILFVRTYQTFFIFNAIQSPFTEICTNSPFNDNSFIMRQIVQ